MLAPNTTDQLMRAIPSSVQHKLKYVELDSDSEIDLSVFPDFLIIGPQRTGTSWIHRNLVQHPQIFMPEQKELYYFNNLQTDKYHPKNLPPISPRLSWYLDFFRPNLKFIDSRDHECRKTWGESYEGNIRGEATATYLVALCDEIISEILTLNPEIKILMMVRDPVERAWSHAKKDLSQMPDRPIEDVCNEEWINFFRRKYQLGCGQYCANIEKWRNKLKKETFFVGRYIDIQDDPNEFLRTVLDFLGARSDLKYFRSTINMIVYPTEKAKIPGPLLSELQDIFAEEIELLRAQDLIR